MTKHLSLRLAWHDDGWNGRICRNPKANVYCIGQHSYPGDVIAGSRDLAWESKEGVAGCDCSKLDQIPACSYSINAFGLNTIPSKSDPPDWFNDTSEAVYFDLPPATACTWPYEPMYSDEVKRAEGEGQQFDYDKRLKLAKDFFSDLSLDRSLIFYYANRSNPFSEDDREVYVLVGVSRLKAIGDIKYYENSSERIRKNYAGGFVWQMPVTSHFPDQGFVIPYHAYRDNDEVLQRLLLVPEQINNFKYAAKQISDDDSLIYVERLINTVSFLLELGDKSEDWVVRKTWLQSLLSELWVNRGPYPGLAPILTALDCGDLAEFYFKQAAKGNDKSAAQSILAFLSDKNSQGIDGCRLDKRILEKCRRNWHVKLREEARELAKNVLCRAAVSADQAKNILIGDRSENGITALLDEVEDDPYILCEQYIGDDPNDQISFTKIDHAAIASPELGIEPLCEKDDWRRLRALLCDELKKQDIHSFVNQDTLLINVNARLSHYPEWKQEIFNAEYLAYDKAQFEEALHFREKDGKSYLYLKRVWDDERLIESQVRELLKRPDITLTKPYKENQWRNALYKPDSTLAQNSEAEYSRAIDEQSAVCSRLFTKPISVIAGSAGTGKTTVIDAILKAIRFTSGNSESFCLLAPTGKAADRLRDKTGETATTIHSFLAKANWLNPNFSLKPDFGNKVSEFSTIILDECSMMDLGIVATLFRALNWNYVNRLILVGDPNQLPPIGRGKVFSDIISFIKETDEDAFGKLCVNVRQMESRAGGRGTGIIDLASMYVRDNIRQTDAEFSKSEVEDLLKKIQESNENVESDLRIVTWKGTDELERKIVQTIESDIISDSSKDLMRFQVISPYRGELFGTDHLNVVIQKALNGPNIEKKGNLSGITVFDKVIQSVNRAGRNAYYSYNKQTKKSERIDVFNGEMGTVWIHPFDRDKFGWPTFRLQKFQVAFERKGNNFVDFSSGNQVEGNIELGYAISVHKAQGSEFQRVYFVLPKSKQALLSTELLYTGITRAQSHLTVFVEDDFRTFVTMRRPEKSRLELINSSVFKFNPLSEELLSIKGWYEEGKIHSTLTEFMVRSKSEVIIANLLFSKGFEDVEYETPLFASDGTFYLPDFTIKYRGRTIFWEHLGLLDKEKYRHRWDEKAAWYAQHFPGQLITTEESPDLTRNAAKLIDEVFGA